MKRSKGTSKEGKKILSEFEKKSGTQVEVGENLVKPSEKVTKSTRRTKKKIAEALDNLESVKMEAPKPSKREVLKTSNLAKFLPNAITITAMCFGLSSIRFAQCNEWEYAVLCILVSALLDMLDGKVARFLDQSSSFGLELDSLSDLVCFGVAPSIVLYLSTMQQVGKVGWGICMFFTICCALRLARFNISRTDSEENSDLNRKYFVGIPAPAGAIVALFPLILFFETESFTIVRPFYVAFFLVFAGCMMISTVRTFSSKIIEINNTSSWVALTIIAFLIICLTTRLWMSLSVLVAFYLVMIPYGVHKYSEALKSAKTKE
jgi:CDP-diacylglycerol--serine O-phosphatidyltransferase